MKLIFLCLILAIVAMVFAVKFYSAKKWNSEMEQELLGKNATIVDQEKQIKAYVDEFSLINARNRELQNQVTVLVAQINETGVRRNKKGQFVSVD